MTTTTKRKRAPNKRFALPEYRGFNMFVTSGGTFIAEHPTNKDIKESKTTLSAAKLFVRDHTQEGPDNAKKGTKVIVRRSYGVAYAAGKLTGDYHRQHSHAMYNRRKVLCACVKMNKKTKKGEIDLRWIPIHSIFVGTAKDASRINKLLLRKDAIDKEVRKVERSLKKLSE